jgi:hypothetical protein
MHSNRTSILRIDPALITLLGFGANNKKIMCYATLNMTKDLSTSNAVLVRETETRGLRSCTSVDDEDDVADLKAVKILEQ